ncbi:MAG: hypothetical protein A2Y90_02950 [Chloroflexi bacterium RBG_13_52_12]|nr:MAG: hypothetical protein A2Y90_02950 [Chloroflexi bacterium RBG_13_52_12]
MNTQRFDFTDFTRIRIERALSIDVLRADSYSVTIGDDFSRIRIEKIGDTLCIERRGHDWIVPFHPRPHVVITMPLLGELTLGGACHGKVIGFQSNSDFVLKLSGACHLEFNTMSVGNIRAEMTGASNLTGDINIAGDAGFNVSGASRMVLNGTGNSARIELSGASQSRLSNLSLYKASVNLSGASSAQLRVSDSLDVVLNGASRLEYIGSPIIGKIQVAGASAINHR